jgi:hypothetical protein
MQTVTDPALRALPLIGAVDQFVDSADVLSSPPLYRRLVAAWPGLAGRTAPAR